MGYIIFSPKALEMLHNEKHVENVAQEQQPPVVERGVSPRVLVGTPASQVSSASQGSPSQRSSRRRDPAQSGSVPKRGRGRPPNRASIQDDSALFDEASGSGHKRKLAVDAPVEREADFEPSGRKSQSNSRKSNAPKRPKPGQSRSGIFAFWWFLYMLFEGSL